MSAWIFCRIVDGDIPAKIVHQDEQALAFEDSNAQAPVHLLVIPKRHVTSVQDCQEEDAGIAGASASNLFEGCTDEESGGIRLSDRDKYRSGGRADRASSSFSCARGKAYDVASG